MGIISNFFLNCFCRTFIALSSVSDPTCWQTLMSLQILGSEGSNVTFNSCTVPPWRSIAVCIWTNCHFATTASPPDKSGSLMQSCHCWLSCFYSHVWLKNAHCCNFTIFFVCKMSLWKLVSTGKGLLWQLAPSLIVQERVSTVLKNVNVAIKKYLSVKMDFSGLSPFLGFSTLCVTDTVQSSFFLFSLFHYPFNFGVWMHKLECENLNCSIFVLYCLCQTYFYLWIKRSCILIKLERSWTLTLVSVSC